MTKWGVPESLPFSEANIKLAKKNIRINFLKRIYVTFLMIVLEMKGRLVVAKGWRNDVGEMSGNRRDPHGVGVSCLL